MARNKEQFQTIRSQGALLPSDVLQRIASLELDGLNPEDYHLPSSVKPNEAISQSWPRILSFWQSFREAREKISDTDETGALITRERWLLPLFQELGYGRLTSQKTPEIEGKRYSIERFWQDVPIHLVGCKLSLDKRAKGVRGAATASPHSIVQEYLNRSDDHLWAFVSNGLQLRILRDNLALSRQSYVEFDLEAMMDGEVYPDFTLLWLLCHQSRLEAEKHEDYWLEKWSKVAQEQGTRILTDLRDGVTRSIEALGTGFISHRKNDHLRRKLESGELSTQEYYRQLLRIVYRLLFLFVSEDRELLHPPEADEQACALYDANYSTRNLRDLASKMRGSKHADLWHILSLVSDALGKAEGCPELGLPGLGSFLWSHTSTADLLGPAQSRGETPVLIRNEDLLAAIRKLSSIERDKTLRTVDYRNLGSEELGSVYESLLELIPDIDLKGKSFSLRIAAGNERKTTGSYYTPDSLVQCLLDSALEPVIEDRLKEAATKARAEGRSVQNAQEEAILNITVCDPAVGSGHFLIAAAHRLARQLARIRTGDTEPVPEDHQHALRDVIRRCVYGVDINPMAAELCKVALWMESLEPGKPLGFLDSHIKVGNALLGTTPELLAEPLPEDAFKPIEGDDKAKASEFKKRHKQEVKDDKKQQHYIFEDSPFLNLADMASDVIKLEAAPQENTEQVRAVAEKYASLITESGPARFLADAWCAAFVWSKKAGTSDAVTHRTITEIRRSGENGLVPWMREEVKRLASEYGFFHWYLAFPQVFGPEGRGGFGCVLGNPPWETLEFKEKEWFGPTHPEIATARTSAIRHQMIEDLRRTDLSQYRRYQLARRHADGVRALIRNSSHYPLCAVGKINTYSIFAELNRQLVSPSGRVGCIVQSGIASDDTTKAFFDDIVSSHTLVSLYDFENSDGLFPGVHREQKFCLLTISGSPIDEAGASFAFFQKNLDNLEQNTFVLSAIDIARINPNTRTCPIFRSARDAILTKWVYSRLPVLVDESSSPSSSGWRVTFRQGLFNMSSASGDFIGLQDADSDAGQDLVPVYEGKLVEQFNHRFATFAEVSSRDLEAANPRVMTVDELRNTSLAIVPRFYVTRASVLDADDSEPPFYLVFRSIANPNNERSSVFAILPWSGIVHSLFLVNGLSCEDAMMLCAIGNSLPFDYLTRLKVGSRNFSFFTIKQIAVPARDALVAQCGSYVLQRALRLTYTSDDLHPFAQAAGFDGLPFEWDSEERRRLRAEIDAALFHAYLGSEEEWAESPTELRQQFPTRTTAVEYICDQFPLFSSRERDAYGGDYRHRDLVVEALGQSWRGTPVGS